VLRSHGDEVGEVAASLRRLAVHQPAEAGEEKGDADDAAVAAEGDPDDRGGAEDAGGLESELERENVAVAAKAEQAVQQQRDAGDDDDQLREGLWRLARAEEGVGQTKQDAGPVEGTTKG
jgi:hypothetical protein